ncbi:MAG TPA: Crp/Fnr family transcriptional regulator [Candidatus Eisenbergiella merdipullorum]|uniref:Crp/Fnr family transcriptional regulator n=1 Tax=Candidatus Eisenbergiella merdipullorum TaxID=2838553 RepID=A0A9D2I8Z1_9FIRM|nr:Crp/Fnr family transcriptional regulator [Candidatus Eisenbergiella merdipullorum]
MDYGFLMRTALFHGYEEQEIPGLLQILNSHEKTFEKGQIIYHAGENVTEFGLILEGSVQIEALDLFGQRSILGITQRGGVFAESYACIPDQVLLVDVAARENTCVLFLSVPSLLSAGTKDGRNAILLRNLLSIAARKNLGLSMRIFHSSPKKIRDRLFSYFSEQAAIHGSTHFVIPLNRQQLADYLGAERTALSKELGKMKREGLIDYRRNEFWIHPKKI